MNIITPVVTRSPIIKFPIPTIPGLPAIDNVSKLIENNRIAKPNELVQGVIHQGTKAVLASGSKAGKTWILMDLALSVATGSPFLRWPTTIGNVLYLNFEIQRVFMRSRFDKLMQRRGIEKADNLDIWNLRGKTADFDALVANIIEASKGTKYAMIVLDPIYKAMVGKSENMAGGVGALCHQLENLAERTGAAIVFAHHFTKGNAKKKAPIDRMSGSGVFARDADTIVTLTEHEMGERCYTVEMTLRNFAPQEPFVVQWDYPVMIERDDMEPDLAEDEPVEDLQGVGQQMYEILKQQQMTSADWQAKSAAANISRASFYRVRRLLQEDSYLDHDPNTKMWSVRNTPAAATPARTGETNETARQ